MASIFYPFSTALVSEWPGTRPVGWAPHWGTDFAVPAGTPVPATAAGTIVRVGDDGLGGFTIDLLADDGMLHRFGHLTWGSARVSVGQRVTPGQILVLSGYSGAVWPPGPGGAHLHWELRRDRLWSWGAWVDPRTLNPGRLGQAAPAPSTTTTKACCLARRTQKGDDAVHLVILKQQARKDGSAAYAIYQPGVKGSWEEFDNSTARGMYANNLASQFGQPMEVTLKRWLELQKKYS